MNGTAQPAISCGVYGCPHEEAALIGKECCADGACAALAITFWLFDEEDAAIWRRVFDD